MFVLFLKLNFFIFNTLHLLNDTIKRHAAAKLCSHRLRLGSMLLWQAAAFGRGKQNKTKYWSYFFYWTQKNNPVILKNALLDE